jgi:hypothetical protein
MRHYIYEKNSPLDCSNAAQLQQSYSPKAVWLHKKDEVQKQCGCSTKQEQSFTKTGHVDINIFFFIGVV